MESKPRMVIKQKIMKKSVNLIKVVTIICFIGSFVFFNSCDYKEIADAQYGDQSIYLPIAASGFYVIDKITEINEVNPTEGQTDAAKYVIDFENRKFIIPMGVYRAGIDNSGSFEVNVVKNTDTINNLIIDGLLTDVQILPNTSYTIPESLTINDGNDHSSFKAVIDLDYIVNAPDTSIVFGLTISSPSRETSDLHTGIVRIDTGFLFPKPDFTNNVDGQDANLLIFQNTSENALSYVWDFGDASTSTEESPTHLFPEAATYDVKLTAFGILGDINPVSIVKSIETGVFPVLDYCVSNFGDSSYEWNEEIVIGDFSYISGDDGGYADFTDQIISLPREVSTPVKLVPGFRPNEPYPEYWKIYADMNRDGTFSEDTELLFDSGGAFETTVTGTITIPATAYLGPTRLRVVKKYTDAGAGDGEIPVACGEYAYGETEDYTLVVLE